MILEDGYFNIYKSSRDMYIQKIVTKLHKLKKLTCSKIPLCINYTPNCEALVEIYEIHIKVF